MKKKNRQIIRDTVFLSVTAIIVALCVALTVFIYDFVREKKKNIPTAVVSSDQSTVSEDPNNPELVEKLGSVIVPDYVTVDLLDIGNARSGEKLINVTGIVIHYVGNAGTTAEQNRNYFGLADTDVCSHFVVGLEGEIIQCVPLNEQSAASNERNINTISIETCHPDKDGKFNQKTHNALVKLTAWLCGVAGLSEDDVIRHYDITGKDCPLYYVEHPDLWDALKADIGEAIS